MPDIEQYMDDQGRAPRWEKVLDQDRAGRVITDLGQDATEITGDGLSYKLTVYDTVDGQEIEVTPVPQDGDAGDSYRQTYRGNVADLPYDFDELQQVVDGPY